MLTMKMSLASMDPTTRETKVKSYGNCLKGYAALVPYGSAAELPYASSNRYSSYAEWADAVGRAINSLSLNSYVDSQLEAKWSATEEMG